MDTATRDELRALRARAYGPTADIHHDPVAVQRLHELEAMKGAAARTPAVGVSTAPPADSPDEPRSAWEALSAPQPDPSVVSTELPPADDLDSDRLSPTAPASRTRIPRRTRLLWASSVVATAAIAAGVTYALTSVAPVAASSGAPQIATLEPTSTVKIPAGWFGAGPSSVAFEFYGLTLFETTGGFAASGNDCFAVIATDQLPAEDAATSTWSIDGNVYSGCRVGDFPATAQLAIDSGVPQELRDRFPSGTALQFVYDGERIGVFLSE